jgi:hypothetical protein
MMRMDSLDEILVTGEVKPSTCLFQYVNQVGSWCNFDSSPAQVGSYHNDVGCHDTSRSRYEIKMQSLCMKQKRCELPLFKDDRGEVELGWR